MAKKKVSRPPRRNKRDWRNAPQDALATAIIVAVETISAAGIFQLVKGEADIFGFHVEKAPMLAIASLGCALLSFVTSRKAEEQKSDTRPEHQARAGKTRWLGRAILLVPIFFLASSFAFDQQHTHWSELTGDGKGSPAWTAAIAAAAMDEYGHTDAQAVLDLQDYQEPKQVRFDLTFFAALFAATFLHMVPMSAAAAAWVAKAETPKQASDRLAEDRALRAAATRERNRQTEEERRKAADKAARDATGLPGFIRGVFTGSRYPKWEAPEAKRA